jgi:hypothetical protein
MIRLVIGRLDYRGVSGAPAITFKEYDGSVRLDGVPDVELKPLTKLIIIGYLAHWVYSSMYRMLGGWACLQVLRSVLLVPRLH